VLKKKILL